MLLHDCVRVTAWFKLINQLYWLFSPMPLATTTLEKAYAFTMTKDYRCETDLPCAALFQKNRRSNLGLHNQHVHLRNCDAPPSAYHPAPDQTVRMEANNTSQQNETARSIIYRSLRMIPRLNPIHIPTCAWIAIHLEVEAVSVHSPTRPR